MLPTRILFLLRPLPHHPTPPRTERALLRESGDWHGASQDATWKMYTKCDIGSPGFRGIVQCLMEACCLLGLASRYTQVASLILHCGPICCSIFRQDAAYRGPGLALHSAGLHFRHEDVSEF